MLQRYISRFDEMAFDKQKYEQKLETYMTNFVTHIIKIKLCDKSFGDEIYKGLSSYCSVSKNYWEKESEDILYTMFVFLNEQNMKSSSKEKAYISASNNILGLMMDELLSILKDVTSKYKNQDLVLEKYKFFKHKVHYYNEPWFRNIIKFVKSLTPKGNNPITKEEAIKHYQQFLNNFLSEFKK